MKAHILKKVIEAIYPEPDVEKLEALANLTDKPTTIVNVKHEWADQQGKEQE